jgi:hypothetical protein
VKREATQKAKFVLLRRRLGYLRAMGTLEALWHLTAMNCADGDITRLEDDLEELLEWDRKPGELVPILLATKWLDRCPSGRLLVHDWADHADQAVPRLSSNSR